MDRVTIKTSTIFIAKGGKTRVYSSVNDVPSKLRKELEQSTNGFNSATILIADRRGREEIVRALSGLPSGLRSRLASSLAPKTPAPKTQAARNAAASMSVANFMKRHWAEILLPGTVGLILWLAFHVS
jgi:hypothetical protein